jgi:hypothetical protein
MLFGREKRHDHDQNRVQELEAQLNHERLMHAQEYKALQLRIADLQRDLLGRDRKIAFLESEFERIEFELYEVSAREAVRIGREKRIKELASQGLTRHAIAREVFPYVGGWADQLIKRVLADN